ncbi:hypothetical protein CC80DRAFT_547100 [Byssothecium circinans]|uniref:BTB domain-containing protein n=1 Tax=Byssothecium circinans TaxID=147558 RepID=A0A6A5U049_9PLEO|nr:hypothetical protein CC80DRAFT_547100 [Byssothecium circinans]
MSPPQQDSNMTASQDFFAVAFKTGIFSDTILHYANKHTIKVHSAALRFKSTWFSQHHVPGTPGIIADPGISPSVLKLFERSQLKPCGSSHPPDRHTDDECAPWKGFRALLEFCYTGQYPTHQLDQYGPESQCIGNIYLYLIGKRYGVNDILPHAAEAFTKEVQKLRNVEGDTIANLVNLVYKLPDLGIDDILRKAALEEARIFADTMSVTIEEELVKSALERRVRELMPGATKELFANGYAIHRPSIKNTAASTSFSAIGKACIRCLVPHSLEDALYSDTSSSDASSSGSEPPSLLCNECDIVRRPLLDMPVLIEAVTGVSLVIWQCQACNEKWACEGMRTKAERLEECPCCDRSQRVSKRLKRQSASQWVTWYCGSCWTAWWTRAMVRRDVKDMDGCICCP